MVLMSWVKKGLNLGLDLTPSLTGERCEGGWRLNDGGIVIVVRQMEQAMMMVLPTPMNRLPILMVPMQIIDYLYH